MNYTMEIRADGEWYTYEDTNGKRETLVVNIRKCVADLKSKNSLMVLWKKNGYISEMVPTYWSVDTYVHKADGTCYRNYDPSFYHYHEYDRKGNTVVSNSRIDFEWLLEATEENKAKILAEIEKRFVMMQNTKRVERRSA